MQCHLIEGVCSDVLRKCHHDTVQSSVGLQYTRPLSPCFFDYRKQPSVSLHDLPWAPMGRFKPLLIREGREWETKEKQTVTSSLGAKSYFPIKGYTQKNL